MSVNTGSPGQAGRWQPRSGDQSGPHPFEHPELYGAGRRAPTAVIPRAGGESSTPRPRGWTRLSVTTGSPGQAGRWQSSVGRWRAL